MKAVFIAGTDTGVGKTVVTGSLAAYLQHKGYSVVTQKWIQTGAARNFSPDIRAHLKMMARGAKDIKGAFKHIVPYAFKAACSPHLASRLERRKIDKARIIKSFRLLAASFDFVLVEGSGGILVPFDKKRLMIDIVKELKLPVLLVAENRVGAINHTLLALEALKKRRLKVLGVVFNEFKKGDKRVLEDNPAVVKSLTGCEVWRLGKVLK